MLVYSANPAEVSHVQTGACGFVECWHLEVLSQICHLARGPALEMKKRERLHELLTPRSEQHGALPLSVFSHPPTAGSWNAGIWKFFPGFAIWHMDKPWR